MAHLCVAAARGDNAQATVDAIRAAGGQAEAVALDVTDAAAAEAAIADAVRRHGRIDILVNNAGITRDQLMLRHEARRLGRRAGDEPDLGLHADPGRAEADDPAAQRPHRLHQLGRRAERQPGSGELRGVEGGLIGFAKAVALEVASRNITVNVVAPGMIETDMTSAIAEKAREALVGRIPLGRLGAPDEVAAAVCFLASDEAAYITGQVLAVNGGMYL